MERAGLQQNLIELSERVLVGGCFGMFRLPDEVAAVFHRGEGSRIRDVAGKEYVDYILGSGPLILGHAHPAVVAAVRGQAGLGLDLLRPQRAGPAPGPARPPRRFPAAACCATAAPEPRGPSPPCAWPGPSPAARRSSSSRGVGTEPTTTPCRARPLPPRPSTRPRCRTPRGFRWPRRAPSSFLPSTIPRRRSGSQRRTPTSWPRSSSSPCSGPSARSRASSRGSGR